MTSTVARSPSRGFYVTLVTTWLLALVLLALSVWPRRPTMVRPVGAAFEADEPPTGARENETKNARR
jgi:hypothetical protein